MTAHTPRTFEVPAALVAAGFSPTVDLDVLDREVEFDGEFGDWAERVLARENTKTLQDVCGDMRLLPRGILSSVQLDDGSLLVGGLVDSDGRVWDSQFNAWGTPSSEIDVVNSTVALDDDEVAFVARALREGADEVWFRPYIPKAFVSAVVAAPAPPNDRLGKKSKVPETPPTAEEIPPGSAIVAVVDPIDEDAVLEMLAITPGPRVLRRHDGNWFDDPEWISVLKSVKPPSVIKLTEAQVASVSAQVDRSTSDQDWEPFETNDREQYQIFTASAGLADEEEVADSEIDATEREMFDALVAVAGRELTPEDVANTERLKRYWTVGEGAAKIRWGTPGAWSRCYRNVVKYMRPDVAKGYCTNLSQRLGGPGVATHVAASSSVVKKSAYLQQLQNESDEAALRSIVAVAGRKLTPKDAASTERLKRYWTVGKGAAKIRWGTPGSWRRCYRHLVKYVGPKVAPGLCTNLSQRLGGPGIATHVTSSAEAVTAANPQGVNAYDKGKTFEQATGGVERDYHGRFAPESGGSARSRRRNKSAKDRLGFYDSKSKFKVYDPADDPDVKREQKKAEADRKRAEADRKRAKREAQREQLAQLSLAISEASAAGDTVKAAELRVRKAELALSFADTAIEKLNAQTVLNNAKSALARARSSKVRKSSSKSRSAPKPPPSNADVDNAIAKYNTGKKRNVNQTDQLAGKLRPHNL